MQLINLTPHELAVYAEDAPDVVGLGHQPILTVPPSGEVLRLATVVRGTGDAIDGVPTSYVAYGRLETTTGTDVYRGMPPIRDGVLYVVALPCVAAVLAACRSDVVVVDRPVRCAGRDGALGAVVGCRALGRPVE
jgi:hypothetical protein